MARDGHWMEVDRRRRDKRWAPTNRLSPMWHQVFVTPTIRWISWRQDAGLFSRTSAVKIRQKWHCIMWQLVNRWDTRTLLELVLTPKCCTPIYHEIKHAIAVYQRFELNLAPAHCNECYSTSLRIIQPGRHDPSLEYDIVEASLNWSPADFTSTVCIN